MDEALGPVNGLAIDWSRPWYVPWREPGQRVAQRMDAGMPLHEALNQEPGAPVRFVAQAALPAGQAYEHYIRGSGDCPVRPGLHDFFNGLAWLRMPLAKARLNLLHGAQIDSLGAGAARGPVRDAITVFDENGALLDAPAALWDALRARDWMRALVELRPLWVHARVQVFGHALLEKLAQPRKEITAHVWGFQCPMGDMAEVDGWLAAQFTEGSLASKPFMPLPLLGIPGWCAGNLQDSFYDDPKVFRRPAP
ncbi:MAG: hypothetical protein JWP43_611 [Ramlibacter sp.]|jgi:hypothetical protein|nr:hypothetical protein [Ramlibacter sp.]